MSHLGEDATAQRVPTPAKKRHVFSEAAARRSGARRDTNSLAKELSQA